MMQMIQETTYIVQGLKITRHEETKTGYLAFTVEYAPRQTIYVQNNQVTVRPANLPAQDADNLALAVTLATRCARELYCGVKITALDDPNC